MEEKIIQYHPSYSEEENRIVHNYIENASERELVQMIRELQKLYSENNSNINIPLVQLGKEIRIRDVLYQKYKILQNNHAEWSSYFTALSNYQMILSIRKAYSEYKKNGYNVSVLDFYTRHQGKDIPYVCQDFVNRALIPEGKKCFIEKPCAPHIYTSIDEIEVIPLSDDASLESIGKHNLKYTVWLMLYYIDSLHEAAIPVTLSFLTRKYATGDNHKGKGKQPIFSTNMLSTPALLKEIEEIWNNIHILKDKCQKLLVEIEND